MRDGFSTPGECPEGMWEQKLGATARGRAWLRNVGECQTDLWELDLVRQEMRRLEGSGLERWGKRNKSQVHATGWKSFGFHYHPQPHFICQLT